MLPRHPLYKPRAQPPQPRQESPSTSDSLLCRLARKRPRQRQRRDVPCRAARLLRMVRKVFLHHANDSDRALSIGHARQPVPSGDAEQLIMHQEALGKARHPAQTGRIPRDPCRVSAPFAVLFKAYTLFKPYTRAHFQEVPARPADIRLLRRAFWRRARRQTNQEETQQRSNKQ